MWTWIHSEVVWFTAVTVTINSLVFVLCGILELVERYGLFQNARIQKKVCWLRLGLYYRELYTFFSP